MGCLFSVILHTHQPWSGGPAVWACKGWSRVVPRRVLEAEQEFFQDWCGSWKLCQAVAPAVQETLAEVEGFLG